MLPTFVHINFTLRYSKHQLDHYSAITSTFCHVDVLSIDIYYSLQILNQNKPFLQV